MQGLQPGAEYLFVVTASNQAGEGAMSNSRSAKTRNAGLFLKDRFPVGKTEKELNVLLIWR